MSNFDAKFDAMFNGELKDDSLSVKEPSTTENSYQDDNDVYFLSSGKNGEKNTIKLRMIPNFHENEFSGIDNLFMLQKKVHKLRKGNQKLNFNCLRFQNDLKFKKNNKGFFDIPEGEELHKCPMCELNPWVGNANENPSGYAEYQKKKSKLSGWVNVYIYDDTLNPENNGTIKKMYFDGRLMRCLKGDMKDAVDKEGNIIQKGLDPFDVMNGADIWIEIAKAGQWDSYDGTKFLRPSPFMNGDREKIKEIISGDFDLTEKIGTFYDYDELKEKIDIFYGNKSEVEEEVEVNEEVAKEEVISEVATPIEVKEEIIEEDLDDFDVDSLIDD